MLYTVRKNDFEELVNVVEITVRESVAETEKDAEFLIDDIVKSLDKWFKSEEGGFCYKYTSSSEIVGFILVKGFWNLSHLFILPSFQGRGIGRNLVVNAMIECREKSPRGKVLVNSSAVAVKFYETMGFKQIGPGIERPGGCIPYEYSF